MSARGTTNAGNANLVPPQSWNAQIQATRNLGAWGTATARLYGRLITDIVDVIPIGATGQSPGNLDGTASLYGLQWTSTFNFDPLGWRGAKLDMNLQFQRTRLTDPLTGLQPADQREHDPRRSTSSSATTSRARNGPMARTSSSSASRPASGSTSASASSTRRAASALYRRA